MTIGRLFLSLIAFMSGLAPGGLFVTSLTLIYVRIKPSVIPAINMAARLSGLTILWSTGWLSLVRTPMVVGLGHASKA